MIFGFVSIVMSIFFISPYGIEGVAVAVSDTVALTNFVTWKIVKNKMGYNSSAITNIKNNMFISGR